MEMYSVDFCTKAYHMAAYTIETMNVDIACVAE